MTGALSVAAADLRQRTRTFATLVLVAAALQLGYLFVPDASAPYATVDLGGWRGIYNSAWMGAATALLSVSFFPLFGFYLLRPAVTRDVALGTLELVLASPLSRITFVLGKWLSNVAFLAGVAGIVVLAAIVMQLVRGESHAVDVFAYLLPFLLVTVPACAVVAAFAVIFSGLPILRGFLGGALWIFVWTGFFMVALMPNNGVRLATIDPMGLTTITSSLFSSLHAHVPAAHISADIEIGGSPTKGMHLFPFDGIAWTAAIVAQRLAWFGVAGLACAIVAPVVLRFAAPRVRRRSPQIARIVAALPLPPLLRVELAQAFGTAGTWWTLGAVALVIAGLVAPAEAFARGIAPLAWIWPIGPIAALSIVDARAGLDGVLLATPTAAWRRIAARWFAACALALAPVAALAFHTGSGGYALVAIAAAGCAVGIALGAIARSPLLFESTALILWYLGPVNRVALFDPAQAVHAPQLASGIAALTIVVALGAATVRAARRS